MIENQYHIVPRVVRSDNGYEFLIPDFYASKGIEHQRSYVETPQQNGRVERKHQHIFNVARTLLFQFKLPKNFLSYVVNHATFLINRVSTPLLNNLSPYQLLYYSLPNVNVFKVFGSLCYASTLQSHRTKLDSRAIKCFLGIQVRIQGLCSL